MLKLKRLFSFVLVFTLLISSFSTVSYASEKNNDVNTGTMDSIDIIIATYRVLGANSAEEKSIWSTTTGIESLEPLYNTDGEITAYYLSFNPKGYAIVNNNVGNPIVLEYSSNENYELEKTIHSIHNKTSSSAEERIYYGGALNYFTNSDLINVAKIDSVAERQQTLSQLENNYSFMQSFDTTEYNSHKEMRSWYENKYPSVPTKQKGSTIAELKEAYEMIDWSDAPNGSYTPGFLQNVGSLTEDYGTTGEFAGVNGADDHCGATAAFNVVTYYQEYLDVTDLYINSDRVDTFTGIHNEIGNGPVTFVGYNSGLNQYVTDRGYTYNYTVGGNYTSIKNGIDNDRMSTVLMSSSLFSWHMVNAVGYREYDSGANYIRIVNGWEDTSLILIHSSNMIGSYTTWISQ